jgi:hypothetical protein
MLNKRTVFIVGAGRQRRVRVQLALLCDLGIFVVDGGQVRIELVQIVPEIHERGILVLQLCSPTQVLPRTLVDCIARTDAPDGRARGEPRGGANTSAAPRSRETHASTPSLP